MSKNKERKALFLRINAEDRAFIDEQAQSQGMDINTYMGRLIDQERIRVNIDQSLPLAVQAINSATESILLAKESVQYVHESNAQLYRTLQKLVGIDSSHLNDTE